MAQHKQQYALSVGGDVAKVNILTDGKFLREKFANGDAVVLDENIVDPHVR